MSEQLPTADALASLARADEPAPLSTEDALAMIGLAVDGALDPADPRIEAGPAAGPDDVRGGAQPGATRAPSTRRPWAILGVAAALALAAVGGWWVGRPGETAAPTLATSADPTRLELPSGDSLAVSDGARFAIERMGEARRVRVTRGSVAFDVSPLGPSESFEVATPHLVARVVGTVFTVESSDEGSVVRVYEGRVVVEHDGEREAVRAGGALAVGAADGGSADPLASVARVAARARAEGDRAEARPAPSSPSVSLADPDEAEPADLPRADPSPTAAPRIAAASGSRLDEPSSAIGVSEVRGWIAAGDAERALAEARRHDGSAWRLLEGDALRATGRFGDAAAAYVRASDDPALRVRAGYLVSTTRAEHLADPSGALDALDRYGCDAPGSPLAERGLVLRARLLTRMGRDAEATDVARDYLARFPTGPHRAAMESL